MDERFRKAEEEYFILRGKLDTGRIGKNLFELALRDSMVQDAQGRWWMLGPDSGNWYMHDGAKWAEADPSHVKVADSVTTTAPKSTPGKPDEESDAAPNRLPLYAGVGCVALVCIAIAVAGAYGIFNAPLRPNATSIALTTPFLSATTPTLSSAPFSTATTSLLATETITPTSTRFFPPRPSITPTPAIAPGVYVTGMRTDPPQPKRQFEITFYPTFLNTTDSPKTYRLKVYIFRPNEILSTGESADNVVITVPVGVSERGAPGWRYGPGSCEDLIARVGWVDDEKHRTLFNLPNGQLFQIPITVCPP